MNKPEYEPVELEVTPELRRKLEAIVQRMKNAPPETDEEIEKWAKKLAEDLIAHND